jgi:hypothetical protein
MMGSAMQVPVPLDSYSVWINDKLREGSRDLLAALWREHPQTMRLSFIAGGAVERPMMAVKTVTTAIRPMFGGDLLQTVADVFDISYGELIGQGRSRAFIEARATVAHILLKRGWSLPRVGKLLGGRDHSTIINLRDNFPIYAARNPLVLEAVREVYSG